MSLPGLSMTTKSLAVIACAQRLGEALALVGLGFLHDVERAFLDDDMLRLRQGDALLSDGLAAVFEIARQRRWRESMSMLPTVKPSRSSDDDQVHAGRGLARTAFFIAEDDDMRLFGRIGGGARTDDNTG